MPELPEVETVARLIRPKLEGRRIEGARVRWKPTVGGDVARFRRRVAGATVARVWRRAKYLIFDLERAGAPAGCIVGHLRMTGRMHVEDPAWDAGAHGQVALPLDDGRVFHFIDVRKFGRLVWGAEPADVLAPLGPEPMGDEFTVDWFAAELRRRRRMLKPLLLDQSFLAGLGNIYVDEALHRSGLHPLRRSDRVPRAKAAQLHGEIRATLAEAIEREGSSFDAFYRTPEGQPGSYQHQFLVYGRDGLPCRTCGRTIEKIVVGQRGTHLCRRCQPVPRARRD
ncbi:bifunctional DNA-formamidopyrimidine glycosylase/DNA-(apurinic or apyrimidinic site) lyase [Engelhardtia mirabilis]|uniref:Formamidopyrimidine-DNA glycosylase n=1 Tax=Engelhardtia mirabilis TaxID=2528011 RepID=A0A518BR61_9BACT|nr:Formamidopyrimidine-DNA glycosylase [Planctomycetes bacterium Pla133]QDV03787.1 Formamidopyrimidine-DNA glycosylase [Planctomycetes bacterium Pla86]